MAEQQAKVQTPQFPALDRTSSKRRGLLSPPPLLERQKRSLGALHGDDDRNVIMRPCDSASLFLPVDLDCARAVKYPKRKSLRRRDQSSFSRLEDSPRSILCFDAVATSSSSSSSSGSGSEEAEQTDLSALPVIPAKLSSQKTSPPESPELQMRSMSKGCFRLI